MRPWFKLSFAGAVFLRCCHWQCLPSSLPNWSVCVISAVSLSLILQSICRFTWKIERATITQFLLFLIHFGVDNASLTLYNTKDPIKFDPPTLEQCSVKLTEISQSKSLATTEEGQAVEVWKAMTSVVSCLNLENLKAKITVEVKIFH